MSITLYILSDKTNVRVLTIKAYLPTIMYEVLELIVSNENILP